MIQLRFITTNSPVSQLIRLFTWSEYSHVEFVIPGEGFLGSHAEGGVKLRPFNYCVPSKEVYGYVTCDALTSAKVIEWARSQIGKPYDFLAILGLMSHRDWQDDKSFFCSELVEEAFSQAGYPLIRDELKYNRITPGDIYRSELVHVIA